MGKYLRWMFNHVLILMTATGILAGGHWMWLGFLTAIIIWVAGEPLSGDDVSTPQYRFPFILDAILFSYVLAGAGLLLLGVWAAGAGDALGVGALLSRLLGYDALAARAANTLLDYVGGALGMSMALSLFVVTASHDLAHRTSSPLALFVSRWAAAITGGFTFMVEHIYGHHRDVGSDRDAATARRGESLYYFLAVRTPAQALAGWRREGVRLGRSGRRVLSPTNVILQALARIALIAAGCYVIGGWSGVAMYASACLGAKVLLEAVTYMGHYGLVRAEGEQVAPRHSWNSYKRIGCLATFNLPRHSHHHDHPAAPFYRLTAYDGVPVVKYGYLTMTFAAFVPPLFFRIMHPQLDAWRREDASPDGGRATSGRGARSGLRGSLEPSAVK